jgi:hypothetical protein
MRLVLPAVLAEFLHLQALRGRLLVLRRGVVPILALGALKRNNIAHCFAPDQQAARLLLFT